MRCAQSRFVCRSSQHQKADFLLVQGTAFVGSCSQNGRRADKLVSSFLELSWHHGALRASMV